MAQPIGMLEYMDENGLTQFVEATEVIEFRSLADGVGGNSQMILRNGGWRNSRDDARELAIAHDQLVRVARLESAARSG